MCASFCDQFKENNQSAQQSATAPHNQSKNTLDEIMEMASDIIANFPGKDKKSRNDRRQALANLMDLADILVELSEALPSLAGAAIETAHFCWRTDKKFLDPALAIVKKAARRTKPDDPARNAAAEILIAKSSHYMDSNNSRELREYVRCLDEVTLAGEQARKVFREELLKAMRLTGKSATLRAVAYAGFNPFSLETPHNRDALTKQLGRLLGTKAPKND